MARESFVYDREKKELVPSAEYYAKKHKGIKRSSLAAPMVMRDISPFENVAVNDPQFKEISSRSQKREMMKKHGLVEAGDLKPSNKRRVQKPRESVRNSIKRSLQQLGV